MTTAEARRDRQGTGTDGRRSRATRRLIGALRAGPGLDAGAGPAARIGPNAVIQTLRTLEELHGSRTALAVAAEAECPLHPEGLIEETHFIRLVAALHRRLGPDRAITVLAGAGRRTGEYVRANRIPRPISAVLPHLPNALGLRILMAAFAHNAWTFVGSGTFRWQIGAVPELCIDGCITCRGHHAARPLGSFYAGAFEALIQSMVDARIAVTEEECLATGGRTCRFRIHLPARSLVRSVSPLPRTLIIPCASF
jgi:divinyl protochlorophyllide a 8-vinyl-reductase